MQKLNPTMQAYTKIKEHIDNGDFSPAQSLHEVELADELEVSRNTVKKALLMLESDGYVTIELNKGAKVRSYSRQEVLEYLELRRELEAFILELTLPCLTEDDISRMQMILTEMASHLLKNDVLNYSKLNPQFHQVIYDACPNRTAVDFLVKLKQQMKKYNSKTILLPGRCESSFSEHKAILNAVIKHDPAEAKACMRRHISNVRSVFDEYYGLLFR